MCSACTYLNENCQNVLSICIQCKYLHEHEKNMFLCKCLGVSDPIYIYCMCIYVFVQSKKGLFPARIGQSHPVLLLLLLESQCQSEQSDERKEECSLQKRVQPEKHCSLVPPGSSPPLYLLSTTSNYSQGLIITS